MRCLLLSAAVFFGGLITPTAFGQLSTRVLDAGATPADGRLTEVRDLNSYHPWTPPASTADWPARRKALRTQLRVAAGVWPMPPKTPANAVVHGKVDRGEYTVEKVFFASYPGHYVTGNLYRPKGRRDPGPAVLSPHGHWSNGRFLDQGEAHAKKAIESGADKTMAGARHPLQARCAQLARMGCVVFHYDMVGYADSRQIPHRQGFTDVEAALRLQNFLGLQTYNAIRAFEFLASLPDVDRKRIGVTGASGGGTQTFMLGAVDDRPAACFPAVMVSTGMQGGCVCENASLLRVGTGNIEIAALTAPRPLGMTAANDWTKEIATKGGPALRRFYEMLGIESRLTIAPFLQFGHNYNQVSREVMYNFMNEHLRLEQPTPVREVPFEPLSREEMSVFDEQHELPADAVDAKGLRAALTKIADKQLAALRPADAEKLTALRDVIRPALQAITVSRLPDAEQVDVTQTASLDGDGFEMHKAILVRSGSGDAVPAIALVPEDSNGEIIITISAEGKRTLLSDDGPIGPVRQALEKGYTILAPDVFLTGEYLTDGKRPKWLEVNETYAGYTFGYNRTLLANRVHDILTTIAFASKFAPRGDIHLVGLGEAGPWVVLAKAIAGDAIGRTVVSLNDFDFTQVDSTAHDMFLPGALKYGGMGTFLALCAPGELMLVGETPASLDWVRQAYRSAGEPDHLEVSEDADGILAWLLR